MALLAIDGELDGMEGIEEIRATQQDPFSDLVSAKVSGSEAAVTDMDSESAAGLRAAVSELGTGLVSETVTGLVSTKDFGSEAVISELDSEPAAGLRAAVSGLVSETVSGPEAGVTGLSSEFVSGSVAAVSEKAVVAASEADPAGVVMVFSETSSHDQLKEVVAANEDLFAVGTKRTTAVESLVSKSNVQAEVVVRKSYLSAAQQRPALTKHDLSTCLDESDHCVVVPDEIFSDTTPLWDDLIIGKFPEDAPHIAKIHVIVNKIWTYGNKSIKIDAFVVNSTTVKFRIRDRIIRNRVLRRCMWNIADKPMMVSNYGPVIEEEQPALHMIPMWVVLKQVPPSYFSWKGLSFLSSAVGEPKRLHPETELCTKFDEAKVFVEVDLTKPLKDSFKFKTNKGIVSEVLYSYPWLPPRCRICTKWGHKAEVCHQMQGRFAETSKEVLVSKDCEKMATATTRREGNQPQQALPHPVGDDTDVGGRDVSPLGVILVEENALDSQPKQKEINNIPNITAPISVTMEEGNNSLQDTAHPVYEDADVGAVGEQHKLENEIVWKEVSHSKSRKRGNSPKLNQHIGSPSRFSVLESTDNLEDPQDPGAGKQGANNISTRDESANESDESAEINSEKQEHVKDPGLGKNENHQFDMDESLRKNKVLRIQPPRSTRSIHRSTKNSSKQVTNSAAEGRKASNNH